MADKPDDSTLRDVRNELVGLTMDQARATGVPVPSVRLAEQFVDPIMRKVEVDAARDADAIQSAPSKNKTVKAGEWYGEEGHSPQIGGEKSRIQGNAEVRSEELGEYKLGKDGKLKPMNGAPVPKGPTVLELVIKKLLSHPQWRDSVLAASKLCGKHMTPAAMCSSCERREARLIEIVGQAKSKFTKQRDRRIIVGGK